jgi:hypothetical protein
MYYYIYCNYLITKMVFKEWESLKQAEYRLFVFLNSLKMFSTRTAFTSC